MKHLWAIVISSSMLAAVRADQPQRLPLLIENVVVIDVLAKSEPEARRPNCSVLIESDRIVRVAHSDSMQVEEPVTRLDGMGKYLVPGFWNMHSHVHWPDDDVTKVILPLMFANGITGLRDMSSDNSPPAKTLHEIRQLQAMIERGEILAPRFMALCKRINGQRDAGFLERVTVAPQTDAQGRAVARIAHLNGCDFVKVYTALPRSAFFGLMDEANKLGLPVAGHLPQAVTPVEASNAGMRSIEHARFPGLACGPDYEPWRAAYAAYVENKSDVNPAALYRKHLASVVAGFDEQACCEILDVFAKNGTYLCPTHTTRRMDAFAGDPDYRADPRRRFIPAHRLSDWDRDLNATASVPPDIKQHFREFYTLGLRVTGLAHQRGVHILVGTDTYDTHVFPGFSYHDELEHLHQAGLSPLEILKSATIRPAVFLGKEESFGSVDSGKMADLLLLDADPLADIGNTRLIHAVVFGGKVHEREELQDMIRGVEQFVENSQTVQSALWDAVIKGDVSGAVAAIEKGADVNALDTRGATAGPNGRRAMNYAASRGDTGMIEALLQAGADINLANRSGYTPLHHAAEFGRTKAAELLIAKGADPTPKNRNGLTPLQLAERLGRQETAAGLREAMEDRQ